LIVITLIAFELPRRAFLWKVSIKEDGAWRLLTLQGDETVHNWQDVSERALTTSTARVAEAAPFWKYEQRLLASQPMCQLLSAGVGWAEAVWTESLVEVGLTARPAGVAAPKAMKPAMTLVVRRIA
jgi:hypothetical protein